VLFRSSKEASISSLAVSTLSVPAIAVDQFTAAAFAFSGSGSQSVRMKYMF
jgi:hypothetical protein